jgi:ABC-type nitrate/sulfonate/bicarbonate transport system substrate-binding protein
VTSGPAGASVTLILFPGGFNWPVWVARERGAFERERIAVEVVTTPGSVFQWTKLVQREAELAITLMDNVIAYREGQGAPGVVVDDAVALMGLDTRSMPTLVTTPDIRNYAALRGKTLAVDALGTGNALVLIGMLQRAGLAPSDYRLEQVGGVAQRFEGLKRGEFAGSLFNAPLDAQLMARGFNPLDSATSLLRRFQGHVVAARSEWARANRPIVVGFLRALLDALAWLYELRNRGEAFAIFERNMPGAGAGAAATAYAVLFDPASGFSRDGEIDVDGVAQLLELRSKYGQPRKTLRDASAYYDSEFLAEAARRD